MEPVSLTCLKGRVKSTDISLSGPSSATLTHATGTEHSLKRGCVATGRRLPQKCRDHMGPPVAASSFYRAEKKPHGRAEPDLEPRLTVSPRLAMAASNVALAISALSFGIVIGFFAGYAV